MESLLDEERHRSKKLEEDLKQMVEELGSVKVNLAQGSEEKGLLSTHMEALQAQLKVITLDSIACLM